MAIARHRLLLLLFAIVWTVMSAWLVYHFAAAIRTWWMLQETVTVNATIDRYEYQERGSGDTRTTVMVVDYSFTQNGQRVSHQTDNIAPLAVDQDYFPAMERACQNKSEVQLFVSTADPTVYAFTKDISYFRWTLAAVFPLVFGSGTVFFWRLLLRDPNRSSRNRHSAQKAARLS